MAMQNTGSAFSWSQNDCVMFASDQLRQRYEAGRPGRFSGEPARRLWASFNFPSRSGAVSTDGAIQHGSCAESSVKD